MTAHGPNKFRPLTVVPDDLRTFLVPIMDIYSYCRCFWPRPSLSEMEMFGTGF